MRVCGQHANFHLPTEKNFNSLANIVTGKSKKTFETRNAEGVLNVDLPDLFVEIGKRLPTNWSELDTPTKLHHLVKAADEVLKPEGNWILLNGDKTMMELLQGD